MDYERLLADVGRITPYQKFIFTLVCLVGVPSAFHHLSIVFTAGIPDFTCDPRSLFVKSSNFQNFSSIFASQNEGADDTVNFTFHDNYTIGFNSSIFDVGQCSVTRYNESLGPRNASDSTELKCSAWFYDRTLYASTAVSKWDLVCDYKWLAAMPASVSMAGIMVGSLLFGIISDRYGRRPVFLISTLMQAVSGLACAFSPHYYVFVATKFLIGFFTSGQFLSAFVISMEIVERKHRTWLGFVFMISWAVGYMILAGIAYAAREWWILQMIVNVPSVLMLLYYFVLPESPRWLLVHGRVDEAMKIIQKLVAGSDANLKAGHDLLVQSDHTHKGRFLDLVRAPGLLWRTLFIFYLWFANNLVYYGLSFNSSNLGGNIYINFLVAGAVEIPAYVFSILAFERIGRKIPLIFCLLTSGLSLLAIIAVPKDLNVVVIVLSMTGKLMVSASFAMVYVYTAEIFPTTVRHIAIGASAFAAKVAGIVSPFLSQLSLYNPVIPPLVFGLSALVAGSMMFFMPETKNKKLCETIAEELAYYNRKSTSQETSDKINKEACSVEMEPLA